MGTSANSGDPDETIKVFTVCQDKINLQRICFIRIVIYFEIKTCNIQIYSTNQYKKSVSIVQQEEDN